MNALNPKASARYFKSMGAGKALNDLSDDLRSEIVALRTMVRESEPGGMCHIVCELLRQKYGWEPLPVSYLSPDGRIIADHVVCILPCGSLLDGTRDQFGEGHSVSLVRPTDPEIGRYRPEFTEDWHPGHPDDTDGTLDGWIDSYPGKPDYEVKGETLLEFGRGWWLEDKSLLAVFEREQGTAVICPSFY